MAAFAHSPRASCLLQIEDSNILRKGHRSVVRSLINFISDRLCCIDYAVTSAIHSIIVIQRMIHIVAAHAQQRSEHFAVNRQSKGAKQSPVRLKVANLFRRAVLGQAMQLHLERPLLVHPDMQHPPQWNSAQNAALWRGLACKISSFRSRILLNCLAEEKTIMSSWVWRRQNTSAVI